MRQFQVIPILLLTPICATPAALAAERVMTTNVTLARATERPTDESLSSNVLSAILGDEILRYDAGNVRASTREGIVTLTGTVHRKTIQQRMEAVAHAVRAVVRVINLLTVDAN